MKTRKPLGVSLLAAWTVLGLAAVAGAAVTQPRNSLYFDWKYEMNVSPELEDLDSDTNPDWAKGGAFSVSGGVLSYDTMPSGSAYFASNDTGDGGIWPGKYTLASGFTIETRLKVLQDVSGKGFGLFAGPGGTTRNAYLYVGKGGQSWHPSVDLGTNANDDDFHVFRVAQQPGSATYSVWRDGVLLSDSLPYGYNYPRDGVWFPDGSSGIAGRGEIDYFRFTGGAFAPIVPEPSSLVLWTLAVAALLWCGRRRGR